MRSNVEEALVVSERASAQRGGSLGVVHQHRGSRTVREYVLVPRVHLQRVVEHFGGDLESPIPQQDNPSLGERRNTLRVEGQGATQILLGLVG